MLKKVAFLAAMLFILICTMHTNGFVVSSAVAQFENSYSKYSENHNTYSAGTGSVRAEALYAELKGKTRIDSYGGKDNVAILENAGDGLIFSVEVPSEGYYEIDLLYTGLSEIGRALKISLTVDGELPFLEAGTLELQR